MLGYLLFSGVTTGALYALVALGIVVVFKATAIVNFAHGELFMIGGFLAYTLHVMLGVPYVLAIRSVRMPTPKVSPTDSASDSTYGTPSMTCSV